MDALHKESMTDHSEFSRRTFIGAAVASLATVSGCTTLANRLQDPKARIQHDISLSEYEHPLVRGQQTLADAPFANAWLATDPAWIDTNFRWDVMDEDQTYDAEKLREKLEQNRNQFFFTASVGGLPYRYGLGSYRDHRFEDGILHIYPKPTVRIVPEDGEVTDPTGSDDEPDYVYDYNFTIWRLHEKGDHPTGIEVHFRPGDLAE